MQNKLIELHRTSWLRAGPARLLAIVVALLSYGTVNARLYADDWSQWRGPTRDGMWRESGIVERFHSPQIALRWRTPIGSGYSGPTVAQGRVYVTDRQTEPQEIERVLCFQWQTGRPLWSYTYPCPYREVGYTAGPRLGLHR